RGAQLAVGLERLRDLTGREFQRIGLSATVGTPDEVGAFLAGVDRPVEIIRVRMPKGMRIRVEMPNPIKDDSEIAERLRVQPGHGVGEVSDGVILATHEDDVAEACAIARRALSEEIEDLVVRKDNRSVLANQLIAIAVSERFASLDEAYETVRRSWPFRELKRADFDEVVAQLADIRMLWSRDGRLGRSSNSLPYFFENISMIPDVKTYRV